MDFLEVLDVFGGTIFSDDLRVDFRDADSRIRAIEKASSGPTASTEQKARSLLLRATYRMLAGDIRSSIVALDGLLCLGGAGLSKRWLLRGRMYRFYAVALQQRPPVLRFYFVHGDPWAMATTQSVGESYEDASAAASEIPAQQPPNPMDIWEAASLLDAWHFSTFIHLSYMDNATYNAASDVGPLTLDFNLQLSSEQFAVCMASQGSPAMKLSLKRFHLETEMSRSPASARAKLAGLLRSYTSLSDRKGAGLCKVLEGDNAASPPFTSPLALNLICQIKDVSWGNDSWDDKEPGFRLQYNAEAWQHYEAAQTLFATAGSHQGEAAVHLRLGCMRHAEGLRLWAENVNDPGQVLTHFEQATQHISRAFELGNMDVTHAQLTTCHQILLDISRRSYSGRPQGADDIPDRARSLGKWLRETQNVRVAQFLGALILRFGRSRFVERRDGHNMAAAAAAARCAQAYYAGLQHPIGCLTAACAHLQIMKEAHNTWAARALVENIMGEDKVLVRAVADIDRLIDGSSKPASLRMRKASMLRGFGVLAGWTLPTEEAARLEELFGRLETPEDINLLRRAIKEVRLVEGLAGPTHEDKRSLELATRDLQTQTDAAACYRQCVDRFHETARDGDVEDAEAGLRLFAKNAGGGLEGEARRAVLFFKVLALVQLSCHDDARGLLPELLSSYFRADTADEAPSALAMEETGPKQRLQDLKRRNAAYDDIAACFLAQAWSRGAQLLGRIEDLLPGFLETERTAQAGEWRLKSRIAAIHEHTGDRGEAMRWYLAAFYELESLRETIPDLDARLSLYDSADPVELYSGLIRLCLAFHDEGDLSPHSWNLAAATWPKQALFFFEQGRARTLLDMLRARETASAEELQAITERVYRYRLLSCLYAPLRPAREGGSGDGEAAAEEQQQQQSQAAEEYAKKLGNSPEEAFSRAEAALREMSDYPAATLIRSALLQPGDDAESLFRWIPADALVIEIDVSMSGLTSLCVSRDGGVEATYQTHNLNCFRLRNLVLAYLAKMNTCAERRRDDLKLFGKLKRELLEISLAISAHVVEPYAPLIRRSAVRTLVISPASYLRLFPIPALLLDGEPLIVTHAIYQVPSLAALAQLARREAAARAKVAGTAPEAGAPPLQRKLPVVAVVSPSAQDCGDCSGVQLVNAGPEIASVCASMGTRPWSRKDGGSGSNGGDPLTTLFEMSDVVHLAAHGAEVNSSPWESFIQLGEGGRFRVVDLARIRSSRAGLVVFGACSSGRTGGAGGGGGGGDDAVGFAHAVLQSGSLSFIGALWKICDLASMLLMHIFYRTLRDRATANGDEEGGGNAGCASVADCWRRTVREFYSLDRARAGVLVAEIEHVWRTAAERGIRPEGNFDLAEDSLWIARDDFEAGGNHVDGLWDFSHPYYWAAFSLVGYGSWSFRTTT